MSKKLKPEKTNNERVVLYLHIPKAGGTTLSDWLFNQLRATHDDIEENGKLVSGVYYYPSGYVKGPEADLLRQIPNVLGRDDLRGVFGHFQFGIHNQIARPSTYITMLRNPVNRVVSLYNFQRLLEERKGGHGGIRLAADMTIEDFVCEPPYVEIDNGQTRRISRQDVAAGRCSDSMLERAKENLRRHFSVVGITERFDETLVLLARTFGWSMELLYYPKNVTAAGTQSPQLPEKTVTLIREKNSLDIKLYEFASGLLDDKIAAQGEDFSMELDRFQTIKQSYYDRVGGWDMPLALR